MANITLQTQPQAGKDYPKDYADFLGWFPDDTACLDYLDWLRWPSGFPALNVLAARGGD
jgi:hypothetical protein